MRPNEPFKNEEFNPDLHPEADLNTCLSTNCNYSLQGNFVANVKQMQTIVDRKDNRGHR